MKSIFIILTLSAGLSGNLTVGGAEPGAATSPVVISTELINRLADEARTNNPGVRAANSRVNAATLNVDSVRTWEDPMAMFGGSLYSSHGFSPADEGNLAYGVEQKLPLWGRPRLNRRVAETEVSMRQAELEYRFQQIRRDIAKALLTTALAERVAEIGEQDLVWLEATVTAVENKYRTGQAVLADTLQIQNEVAQRRDTLLTERHQLDHERVALNRFLNRAADSSWPKLQLPAVAPEIPYSAKLITLALQNEPQIKVLEQQIKQAEATAAATRKSRLPDVSLGVEGRQFSDDGGFRSGMFTLRFSLPWANGDKYRKDYERDREKQKSVEQDREEQILMVKEELHHLTVGIEAMRREALLHRDEITARAGQVLTSRLVDWETGRGALRDILEARRMLLESQITSARAISEQRQMLAELLLWTGLENSEALIALANEPSVLPHHTLQP